MRKAKANWVPVVAAIPALIIALTSWIEADAAKKAEARTYNGAADMLGAQAEDIMHLEARIAALEKALGKSIDVHGNTFNTGGGAGIHVGDTPGGPRDPKYFSTK